MTQAHRYGVFFNAGLLGDQDDCMSIEQSVKALGDYHQTYKSFLAKISKSYHPPKTIPAQPISTQKKIAH